MILDLAKRGNGKTTRAVQWVMEGRDFNDTPGSGNRILCVIHHSDKNCYRDRLDKSEIISFKELLNEKGIDLKDKEIWLDGVDFMLNDIVKQHGSKLAGFSMTEHSDEENQKRGWGSYPSAYSGYGVMLNKD